ncbi:hypothetical protein PHYPO_G00138570 [Pangasianodon hypophthalmus]|uniref:V-SNARE coiled-coil homology domain-containing protein n=2 Tax=Pangasianodon hypophthalmus TaxID=310915 RepID=A0A5N5KCP2_PANHP|nr:hypothetical protein PHYPO_G00138570 [Pangasianodon hypophthalmus]
MSIWQPRTRDSLMHMCNHRAEKVPLKTQHRALSSENLAGSKSSHAHAHTHIDSYTHTHIHTHTQDKDKYETGFRTRAAGGLRLSFGCPLEDVSDPSAETKTETMTNMENGRSQLQQAQQDVEEVRVIMLENLNKASEREGKLGDLENRADQLLEQSKVFSKTANQVKQKKQWENMKMKVILAVIVGVVVVVAVVIIAVLNVNR